MFVFYIILWLVRLLLCKADFTFEQGIFSVETYYIPSLTANSATTLTLTGPATTETTAVPVWHCTSGCENDNYGIVVTPPVATVTGFPGDVFPPDGYPVKRHGKIET